MARIFIFYFWFSRKSYISFSFKRKKYNLLLFIKWHLFWVKFELMFFGWWKVQWTLFCWWEFIFKCNIFFWLMTIFLLGAFLFCYSHVFLSYYHVGFCCIILCLPIFWLTFQNYRIFKRALNCIMLARVKMASLKWLKFLVFHCFHWRGI